MSDAINAEPLSASHWAEEERHKIVSLDDLARRPNAAYVLTKGVFDILHAGHLRLLSCCADLARPIGAKVIVTVASDDIVRARKGPKRPIQTWAVRAAQIAAVHGVDFVLASNEREPLEAINRLRPAVYVKGADTALASAPVAGVTTVSIPIEPGKNLDLVAAAGQGARVVIFTDDGQLSTSDLVRAILASHD